MSGLITGIISAVIATGQMVYSIDQANQAKDAQRKAENAAKQKLDEAMKRLDVNYMESLAIPMEAYERQSEEMLQVSANVLEAAREGDQRGVGATAGQILGSQLVTSDLQRGEIEKTIFNLDAAVAEEESRLRDVKTQVNLQEAAGAQMAAAAAGEAAQMHQAQAVQAGGQAISSGISAQQLYSQNKTLDTQMTSNKNFQTDVAKKYDPAGTKGISTMSELQFKDYMGQNFTNKEIRNMFPKTTTSGNTTASGNTVASGAPVKTISQGAPVRQPLPGDAEFTGPVNTTFEPVFWKGQINPQTMMPFRSYEEYMAVMGR